MLPDLRLTRLRLTRLLLTLLLPPLLAMPCAPAAAAAKSAAHSAARSKATKKKVGVGDTATQPTAPANIASTPAAEANLSADTHTDADASLAARYQQAITLLNQNQPQAAQRLLETIVAQRPEFAGAWLDLALATYRSGETESALEHLAYIRQQFPLTPAIARQIDAWQQTWQTPQAAPATPAQTWQGEIQLDAGYNSNVNAGIDRDQLTLSIPGGSAILPLDPAYRPRSDRYTQISINTWRQWATPRGSLYPLLQFRARNQQQVNDYDQLDLQAGLVYQTIPDAAGRSLQITGLVQHTQLGGAALNNTQRLIAQRLHTRDNCRLAWGGELEWRQYPQIPLDGRIIWLDLGLACTITPQTQTSATLRQGFDTATQNQRPGGNNRQTELTLQASHQHPNGPLLEARWQYTRLHDQEGYSPLLADNQPRQYQRNQLTLALRQAITPDWSARLGIELQHQTSNLPLFTQDARQLSLGLSRIF